MAAKPFPTAMAKKRPAANIEKQDADASLRLPEEGNAPAQSKNKPEQGLPAKKAVKVKLEQFPPQKKKNAVEITKIFAKLKEDGKPQLAEQYSACPTQQQKREFLYTAYSLDPEVSKKKM